VDYYNIKTNSTNDKIKNKYLITIETYCIFVRFCLYNSGSNCISYLASHKFGLLKIPNEENGCFNGAILFHHIFKIVTQKYVLLTFKVDYIIFQPLGY
jgi:hypothetical protein